MNKAMKALLSSLSFSSTEICFLRILKTLRSEELGSSVEVESFDFFLDLEGFFLEEVLSNSFMAKLMSESTYLQIQKEPKTILTFEKNNGNFLEKTSLNSWKSRLQRPRIWRKWREIQVESSESSGSYLEKSWAWRALRRPQIPQRQQNQ